ncbi:hypothetical protein GCM10010495_48670 [Kitasatospora herbaricolor]|uniref:hypothetical protein n=1 Tax=Kitasatospora herbaricolor TaxID=68217 RepID=UPI00174E97ED|nr:hypothetical protein [Kitasatospora herbaricolor]MDQ0305766.1 hypothetical protein [Kitasatospora herbaricolor]GGV26924.1 hypothetical protein GCM10010495_48670 [Kitasatospora herbaricolor]
MILSAFALLPLLTALAAQYGGHLVHGYTYPRDVRVVQARPGQTSPLHWHVAVDPGMEHLPIQPLPDPAVLEFVGADRVPAGRWVETSGDAWELAKNRGITTAHVESGQGCPSDYNSYREHDVYLVSVAP